MIVDVLRNDLGRVCRPGQRPRPAAVPARADGGRAAPGLDGDRASWRRTATPSTCSSRAFPGGSITGAPKIRAMEILEGLEPVRRGPYTGAIGWIGPDGAMQTSIVIRTFVADGRRLTLHVGGGITWQSDPAAEWDETVTKARGPLGAIGAVEVGMSGPADAAERRGRPRLGGRPRCCPRTAAPVGVRSRLPARRRRSSRRCACAAAASDRAGRARRAPPPLRGGPRRSRCRTTSSGALADGIAALLAAEGLDGPDGDASIRITVSRGPFRGRGLLPPDEVVDADDRRSRRGPSCRRPADHLERGLHLVASAVRRDPANPLGDAQDDVARRLRLRPARGPPRRRRRRAVPDHRRPPVRGRRPPTSSSSGARRPTGPPSSRRRRSTARSCPGRPGRGCWLGRARRAAAGRGPPDDRADLADADEAFLSSASPGSCR